MATTKKQYLQMISEIVTASEHREKTSILNFVNREIELLDKKHEKLNDKKAAENADVKAAIVNVLTEAKGSLTISEMLSDERLATYGANKEPMSNQRLSALVRQLVQAGTVKRTEANKKAYFHI